MQPERWQLIDQLFHETLNHERDERSQFLVQACGGDELLRKEVEALVASHEGAESFIEAPASALAAELLAKGRTGLSVGDSIGTYTIRSVLGIGGMGEVYLAQDKRLGRQVALKLLPAQFTASPERIRRFELEARAASALNHPNIVTIHEIGNTEGTQFIVTEFVEGKTIRDLMTERTISLIEALDVTIQAASALDAAHKAGIVHRDIKPENMMLRNDGYLKILDFGLAKLTELPTLKADSSFSTQMQIKTNPGMVMGTVRYMSPEQTQGEEIDARTDLWSLGVVLFEILNGCVPFEGKTTSHVIVSILESEPKPFKREVPSELQRILTKVLRKQRDLRYQSARDLTVDLRNLKQELEVGDRLKGASASTAVAGETGTQIKNAASGGKSTNQTIPTQSSVVYPTSSAEYLVGELKRHKRGLFVGIAALIISVALSGIAIAAYFAFSRNGSGNQISAIAVMPFVNESGNSDVEYLSDGMTETLIKSLSQLPNLAVKSRSTVFYYKGKETSLKKIGDELNVQAVLLGRVGGRGDDLKLSLELVNTQTQDVIWSEQYDRKQSDLVSLQREIAKDVSTKLKIKLSGIEEAKVTNTSTANPEAYQAYLKGRYYWNRRTAENLKKAIEQFKAATDRDPNYALAFAGLADCYVLLPEYAGVPNSEALPQAKAYAERAIALDDQLAEPHASLGLVNQKAWQWAESEREFKRAIRLNPNYATAYHWYSNLLKHLGRFDEAALMIKRAQELDPLSSIIGLNASETYQIQNDHNASIENTRKIIELDPNFSTAYNILGLSYLKQGRYAEAIANLEKAVELSNRDSVRLMDLGYGYGVAGKRTEATAIAKELEEKYASKESIGRYAAGVYAGLGEKDKAFEWLEKDFQKKEDLGFTRWEVPYESLRDDPRYKNLLKRMNLPE